MMRKKLFSWLAMLMVCVLLGGMITPLANAAVQENDVRPPQHDGYIGLTQYVEHVQDNIFKVQLTLETFAKSTTSDIVIAIDASENMLVRKENGKTYLENAADAAYTAASIWLDPKKNPLNAESSDRNRVWIIFYNGKAYDMNANLLQTGVASTTSICYISTQAYDNPIRRQFTGRDVQTSGSKGYRSFANLNADLRAVVQSALNKTSDITTQNGAFNNDIKAYQQRYTAVGLAAAYDIFADYSKTGNIVTETNRKILYLLSNGPDYERDDVYRGPSATVSSSQVPQEGSMRMEALFMAKALKLQLHSYGTSTETSLKTAAAQIADAEGNSYESGVKQPPALAASGSGASSYSPLSLDTHRVVVSPPDASSYLEVTRYIGSTAQPATASEAVAGSVDSHPYYTSTTGGPVIASGSSTDPFAIINGYTSSTAVYPPAFPGATHAVYPMGTVTNFFNGSVRNTTNLPGPGAPMPNQRWGNGHFEYQMFADTAPFTSSTGYSSITTASDFSTAAHYLAALNTTTAQNTDQIFYSVHGNDGTLSPSIHPGLGLPAVTNDVAYSSPVANQNRTPLDGYNHEFIPDYSAGTTSATKNTYVYTYADADTGVNASKNQGATPKKGPDNAMPLKKSYERIADNAGAFGANGSGGMNVEIWSVGLFAGETGLLDGDTTSAKETGEVKLGQETGERMYSMGTGYGSYDPTTAANINDTRWEQGTALDSGITGTAINGASLPGSGTEYKTDYTGYTYAPHTRPTHIDATLANSTSATDVRKGITTDGYAGAMTVGGALWQTTQNGLESTSANGYNTGTSLHNDNFVKRENVETLPFTNQGMKVDQRFVNVHSNWLDSTYSSPYVNFKPVYIFGTNGYQYITRGWNQFTSTTGAWDHWTTTTGSWTPAVSSNGTDAYYSYIPPNYNSPANADPKQEHYSPNVGWLYNGSTTVPTVASGTANFTGFVPTTSLPVISNNYRSLGDGGNSGAASVKWFDLIDWHETTGATGTSTQNDDSKGDIPGQYDVPNNRHNIWRVATASATMPLTAPGSIPRDHSIYDGTGINVTYRSELQKHFLAISGVQTSKTSGTLKNPSGFDPDAPWQNSLRYYWSKQTFLTTARKRQVDTIQRVQLVSDTAYKTMATARYPFFASNTTNNQQVMSGLSTPPYSTTTITPGRPDYFEWKTNWSDGSVDYSYSLNTNVYWRYPWISENHAWEGENSTNRDFQNFYEYAGYNYTFDAYQKALDQILASLRYDGANRLEQYDELDHEPVVRMISNKAPYTGKNSIYDVDPDELDTYDRLVRVFEDLTYDFYRVSDKGGEALVILSDYFDLYKMPGLEEFFIMIDADAFPYRYRVKNNATASYNVGTKTVRWLFDNGVYAGVSYNLTFYVTMDKDTDPDMKHPFQVNAYLNKFRFKSMIRYSGKENNNRYIVTKNFPSSYVNGIKGLGAKTSNVVIMNDYSPKTIDGSGNILASTGKDTINADGTIAGVFPQGAGAAEVLQKAVPIYTASVTPAPKKLIDEIVDDATEEVPVTGILGVVAVIVVSGLFVFAVIIKRRSISDK